MFSRRSSGEMFGQFWGWRREVSRDWWSWHPSLWRIITSGWGWQTACWLSLHLHHPPKPIFGLLIKRKIGKYLINTTHIQLGIEWVLGPLKFQLIMTTVTRILTAFMMKVKRRYLAIRGRTREVGGKILETRRRNTTSERRMLIPRVTFSPASAAK